MGAGQVCGEKREIDLLTRKISESAEEVDTYFYFDKERECYRYYTLRKLNKKNLLVDFEIYEQKYSTLSKWAEFTNELNNSSFSYFKRTLEDYYFFQNYIKENLSMEQYDGFIEAHLARMSRDYERALEILESLINEMPHFFYGRYELGLVHNSMNDIPNANNDFTGAADLAEVQSIMDSSLFIILMGFFCFKMKCATMPFRS